MTSAAGFCMVAIGGVVEGLHQACIWSASPHNMVISTERFQEISKSSMFVTYNDTFD